MESIGKQVRLPINTAFQIAMQGIKIRIGRALVTISGVVLGIAFLMSIITGNIITQAVSQQQLFQDKLKVMMTAARGSVGVIQGKTVAIAVLGTPSDIERTFVHQLVFNEHPAAVRGYRLDAAGLPSGKYTDIKELPGLGDGCDLLLILGDANACPNPLDQISKGMNQLAVIDSNTDRTFASLKPERDFFFGSAAKQEAQDRAKKAQEDQARMHWIVAISLLVTVIGIANALLMSVTERFKEIGTMKCLGALSGFIRQLFLIESTVIGLVGSLVGIVIGILIPLVAYGFAFGFGPVLSSIDYAQLVLFSVGCLAAGCLLSMIAAIYPATIAARMIPAMALRSNV